MAKEITCKTGLKKNVIKKAVFDREVKLCKKLSRSKKCGWGICKNCGVIPLLIKLHKGALLECPDKIKEIRSKFLK